MNSFLLIKKYIVFFFLHYILYMYRPRPKPKGRRRVFYRQRRNVRDAGASIVRRYNIPGMPNYTGGAVNLSKGSSSGIPNRLFVKFKYSDTYTQTTTTGMNVRQMRGNGLYDPDYSGVGHQPRLFDQFASLYNDYRVHAVKFRATFGTTTSNVIYICGIGYHGSLAQTPSDITELKESKACKSRIARSEKITTLTWYLPMTKIFGRSKATIQGEKDYAAGFGANPNVVGGLFTCIQNIDETTSTDFKVMYELTYLCELNNTVLVSES